MTNAIRTLEQTITWLESRKGISRHDDKCDWSGGYNVDDCALCMSMAVYGERVAWNVDVLKTVGSYHKGKGGLRRGDVVLYDWDGDGVGDHTEMCLGAPDSGGGFKTIGANGSDTIAVAVRSRNNSVMGFLRPNYIPEKISQPTTITAEPIIEQDTGKLETYFYKDTNSPYYELRVGGAVRRVTPAEWRARSAGYRAAGLTIPLALVSAADYAALTGK